MRNFTLWLAAAAAAVSLAACGGQTGTTSEVAPQDFADMLIHGGVIYTGVEDEPTVEAVIVKNGRISAVGAYSGLKEAAGPETRVIDLDGAALFPGFTDAHAHLLGIGMRELTLNLEGVGSIEELVEIVSANALEATPGEVIIGRGWIETGWPEGRFPTRDDLDPVSAENPVILTRADGHALVANSAALAAANIDGSTVSPAGGRIEKDASGRPTGVLVDYAMSLVGALDAAPDEDKKREAYTMASDVYAAYGWTGMHNMSVDPANVSLMEELSRDGALKIRVYNEVDASGLDGLIETGPQIAANERIITRGIKLYIDGALGSRGAALDAPYSDAPDTDGLLLMTKEQAMPLFEKALRGGVQVVTHAIGDRGNRLLLDWYAETFDAVPESERKIAQPRWRDEHSQILHVDDIPRFAELGVVASMQPSHAIGDLYFAPARLGADRLDGAYPWRSLIDSGAVIAGGSDAPVERGDPRIEFYAAVARRGLDGYQDTNWRAEEAVTRAEALKMFTIWPAYASFQEDDLGTIEAGKKADFTVFANDIMKINEEAILDTAVVMTIVDGEVVYEAE